MDQDKKQEIDALFSAKQEQEDKVKAIREERESKEAEFLNSFLELRASVIKPAMEKIIEYLDGKGFKSAIQETEEDRSGQQQTAASITISFGPRASSYSSQQHPHFTARADRAAQKVQFHECTIGPNHGGHAGSAGSSELEEVTETLIQNKIMKVLREIIK